METHTNKLKRKIKLLSSTDQKKDPIQKKKKKPQTNKTEQKKKTLTNK